MSEHEIDAARLYHLNSATVRSVVPHLAPDGARKPAERRIHPGARRIALPGADLDLSTPLGTALTMRRSHRDFADAVLPQLTLGRLLFACAGVTGTMVFDGVAAGTRTYPSGGGLYPLEIYPVLQRVEGIADGIHHYDPWTHELEEVRAGHFADEIAALTLGQPSLANANALLFITAVFERSMFKYGQRGYRYTWLEAGHLGQNLCLAASALGLGAVAMGGFYDADANAFLGTADGEDAIYAICIGVPRS